MRFFALVVLFCAVSSCAMRQDTIEGEHPPDLVTESATASELEDYDRTIPKIFAKPLNRTQKSELDQTLPLKVREVLEKAETLEVLGLSSEDKAGIGWYPDVKVSLPAGNERSELLQSFFFDASAGPNPSACFIPRHGLRATYKGKTVDVIICYECHLFVVAGDLGEFDGGVYKDGSAAHHLFERIIRNRRDQ